MDSNSKYTKVLNHCLSISLSNLCLLKSLCLKINIRYCFILHSFTTVVPSSGDIKTHRLNRNARVGCKNCEPNRGCTINVKDRIIPKV